MALDLLVRITPNDKGTLGRPPATTLRMMAKAAETPFADWLLERKHARQIPHRMEAAGYVAVRNPASKSDGLWCVGGGRKVIYARRELSLHDQLAAAQQLINGNR